ncbi:hypothetical protein CGMCC3_g331 [Colletotrichum fructicola]|nr:uncharacterized protein CGMCC3_g331 [Colletotrichum fructicola]KAE9583463.1 hypothetical protein CGMCC3_g331 [Colletotrichum fructicola]
MYDSSPLWAAGDDLHADREELDSMSHFDVSWGGSGRAEVFIVFVLIVVPIVFVKIFGLVVVLMALAAVVFLVTSVLFAIFGIALASVVAVYPADLQ